MGWDAADTSLLYNTIWMMDGWIDGRVFSTGSFTIRHISSYHGIFPSYGGYVMMDEREEALLISV